MHPTVRIIEIHPEAPPKPSAGATCNGCGVCCLAEPCPVGVVLSGRLSGACRQLQWRHETGRYVCGVLERTAGNQPGTSAWRRALHRVVSRWISAGSGCDCRLEVEPPQAG